MLEAVAAEQFNGRILTGKTWPCQLNCRRSTGESAELIAKFSAGCERRVAGLVVEALAAMLAADLDLPVPEPFLVLLDEGFIELLPPSDSDLAARIRQSVRAGFGSLKLPPGFMVFPSGKTIPVAARLQAAEIFAFDCLIQNPDRRPENPNLLFDGSSFAIFDHELAFMTEGIIGWQPPWQLGSLQNFSNRHVLHAALAGRTYDFARMQGAWQAITDRRIEEYRKALPTEWVDGFAAGEKALRFLAELRDNVRPALTEVARVLA
jgi:hypothetical protein